jgi:hypothetical protein
VTHGMGSADSTKNSPPRESGRPSVVVIEETLYLSRCI